MDIIDDLPNDLKYTIKDIVIDYRNKQKFIRDNIKKHTFYIKKIFTRKKRGNFSLYVYVYIIDNFIYGNCFTDSGGYWYGVSKNIRCIPIMPFRENKKDLKKLARNMKDILNEYILYTYNICAKDFQKAYKHEYELDCTDWKKSVIDNKTCRITKKKDKLKTKDVYKGLCELWFPNLDLMESIDMLKNDNVYIHRDTDFNLEDDLYEIESYPICEPFAYRDLVMMQKKLPIIYSLLEKNDKLYSIYMKLPDDIFELIKMNKKLEDIDTKYCKIHNIHKDENLHILHTLREVFIVYDPNDIEDRETFNTKVELIFDKYGIRDACWRYNCDSGYIIAPDMRNIRYTLELYQLKIIERKKNERNS
jgi:hypothetical protein